MAKKKLSTQEILAAARAEAAKKKGDAPPQTSEESSTPVEAASKPADAAAKPVAPSPASKSTKDILAAARAQVAANKAGDSADLTKPAAKKQADAGGGSPKSTKDILAAARAQAGTGDGCASRTSETSAKGQAAEAAKPAGERPPVQEMLKAIREGKKPDAATAVAEAAKPAAPPVPPKPPPVKKAGKPKAETRRNFLVALPGMCVALVATPFRAAWTAFTAACSVFTAASLRFMMPNVLVEPPSKFKIGLPSDYPSGTVSTKWKAQFGVWIVHTTYEGQDVIYALLSVCTHLGCTPNWLEAEQKFKCPCHGSGFYVTGINFEGPAPRPLERVGISEAPDGMLEVDKSVKFQQEMGQWDDGASYFPVV